MRRSVRSLPSSGELWVSYLRALVSLVWNQGREALLKSSTLPKESHGQDADIIGWPIQEFVYKRLLYTVSFSVAVYQDAINGGRLSAKAISDVSIAAAIPSYRLLRAGVGLVVAALWPGNLALLTLVFRI